MQLVEFIIDKSKLIGSLAIVAIIVQLFLSRPRWQYYPLYLLMVLYFILIFRNKFKAVDVTSVTAKWILGIGISLLLISIFFLLAFPKEELPKPSGQFKIGTRIYDLEDKSRNEIYTKENNDNRKIKYQIWYPALKINGYKKAKWIHDGKILTRHLAKSMHLPAFMLDHTADIYSNSYYEAPLNNELDKYPVVIISHGWKGFRELHTDFAEELASNGFIAISIDHTYGSQAVKFKDDSVAYLKEEVLPSRVNPSKYTENANALITTYGKDVASVLDDLERLNNMDEHFKGKLDLKEIGLLGHSTGGGGDVYISLEDRRVKALLGLDVWVNPIDSKKLKQGLSIPALFLRSEQWSSGPNNTALNEIVDNSNNATLIQMDKTNHVDLTMTYMYSPLTKYIGFTGKLGGRKSAKIQRKFIISFFDRNLRDNCTDNNDYLKEISDKYENIKMIED